MNVKAAEQLVGIVFLSREYAHREHLSTTSYAAHKALGEFYEAIIPIADSFAEAFQGRSKTLLKNIPYFSADTSSDPVDTIEKYLKEIQNIRYDVADKEETAIQNIIDELEGEYYSAIYKLTFLK